MRTIVKLLGLLPLLLALTACDINNIPRYDEQVKASWAEVQNQYQRRSDLIPNLVEVVKESATYEQETLLAVTAARENIANVNTDHLLDNSQNMTEYLSAQNNLSRELQALNVQVERYPALQANQSFIQLSAQLEGTENRIALARRDFIESVQVYNSELRTYPGKIWRAVLYRDMAVRPDYFEASPEANNGPAQVDFQ